VTHHVEEGRSKINFSTWDQPQKDVDELTEVVEEGEMPLASYTLLHTHAKLDEKEKTTLLNALKQLQNQR
jgi:hypothetical protein